MPKHRGLCIWNRSVDGALVTHLEHLHIHVADTASGFVVTISHKGHPTGEPLVRACAASGPAAKYTAVQLAKYLVHAQVLPVIPSPMHQPATFYTNAPRSFSQPA